MRETKAAEWRRLGNLLAEGNVDEVFRSWPVTKLLMFITRQKAHGENSWMADVFRYALYEALMKWCPGNMRPEVCRERGHALHYPQRLDFWIRRKIESRKLDQWARWERGRESPPYWTDLVDTRTNERVPLNDASEAGTRRVSKAQRKFEWVGAMEEAKRAEEAIEANILDRLILSKIGILDHDEKKIYLEHWRGTSQKALEQLHGRKARAALKEATAKMMQVVAMEREAQKLERELEVKLEKELESVLELVPEWRRRLPADWRCLISVPHICIGLARTPKLSEHQAKAS